jgi:hypothetical protein
MKVFHGPSMDRSCHLSISQLRIMPGSTDTFRISAPATSRHLSNCHERTPASGSLCERRDGIAAGESESFRSRFRDTRSPVEVLRGTLTLTTMTSEPQNPDQHADETGQPADSTSQPTEPVSVRRKAGEPTSGVSVRSNTADALEQLRQTASSATQQINDFTSRNTGSRSERDSTIRQVAERSRGEAGRGLRALAEAAAKLADLVDGTSERKGQHAGEPRVFEQPRPEDKQGEQG